MSPSCASCRACSFPKQPKAVVSMTAKLPMMRRCMEALLRRVVVVEIIRRHLEGVENAAVVGHNNAKAESINAHIQQLKRRAAIVEWDACEMRSCFIWAGWICIPKACHHGNGKANFRLRFLQSCNQSEEWVRNRFGWL